MTFRSDVQPLVLPVSWSELARYASGDHLPLLRRYREARAKRASPTHVRREFPWAMVLAGVPFVLSNCVYRQRKAALDSSRHYVAKHYTGNQRIVARSLGSGGDVLFIATSDAEGDDGGEA